MSIADINKLTIEDIRTMSPAKIRSLSDSELRRATQVMMNAANKRVSRMMGNKVGRFSTTAEKGRKALEKGEKLFNLKGAKNRSQIKARFDQMRTWLDPNKKSHTIAGFKVIHQKAVDRVGEKAANSDTFWDYYRKIEKDYNGSFPGSYDSTEAQKIVAKIYNNGGTFKDVEKFFKDVYESSQLKENEDAEDDFQEWNDDSEEEDEEFEEW